MPTLSSWKKFAACLLFSAAVAFSACAQTFTVLHTFDLTDGAFPFGALVQGLDGNFYGTTQHGNGQNICNGSCGTVFKITPEGALTTIHNFVKTDGGYPTATLVLGTNGNFYGSTNGGLGFNGAPNVPAFIFEITPAGALTNLTLSDGASANVVSALLQNSIDGNFYGTAQGFCVPAVSCGPSGIVFSVNQNDSVTVLHNFCGGHTCGGIARGFNPQGPLIQGTDLFMYGTTQLGGNDDPPPCVLSGCGTVFKIGTGGNLTTLHAFDPSIGESAAPLGPLAEGSDGNFYGTTGGFGTVFKMTPAGDLTTLYIFCPLFGCADGSHPMAGVIQATDGNFYGTTEQGGAFGFSQDGGFGTVFQITPTGTLTTVHSFDETDGMFPQAGLVQGTDGNLYGVTTGFDGTHAWGTIFKITTGLAPFVKTVPVAAYPGKQIFILGTNLTGATSVTFGGVSAAFTVVSATEITATVPKGATTGTVQVVTPGGTLSNNVTFRVF